MPTRSDSIRWAVATATSRDSAVLASVTARLGEPGSSTNEVAARLAESRAAASLSTAGPRSVSLAHHGGRAIAAAALHPTRIGVDLERDGEILFAHARYFLNTREQKELGRLSLTELWALKEAAWKALGLDDTVALT